MFWRLSEDFDYSESILDVAHDCPPYFSRKHGQVSGRRDGRKPFNALSNAKGNALGVVTVLKLLELERPE